MTLINNADPYQAGPLPDSSEDIANLIEETVGGGKFAKEMASLSGTWYSKFVQEINNVKEQKDADLAQIMVCFSLHSFGTHDLWMLHYCILDPSLYLLLLIMALSLAEPTPEQP
jgi:hypothetical protein